MLKSVSKIVVAALLAGTLLPLPVWSGPAVAEERSFSHRGVSADADRYEAYLKTQIKPSGRTAAELKAQGDRLLVREARGASRAFAAAVAAEPHDAEAWLGLAKALLAVTPDPNRGSERYELPLNASAAALRAYENGTTNEFRAQALAVLSDALVKRSYFRPALDALAQSLAMVDDGALREAYDKLRAEHGFRMMDYKTENETGQPRVCVQFSEGLSKASGVDFSKFVLVDGKDPQSISAEGRQLCLDGLSFGRRYEVKLKAGLPSDVGEVIEKAIEIAAYVPDRKPLARFTGRSYVLPSRGQQGIPVVSVNTQAVGIAVYRIGDRGLAATLQGGDMSRQLSSYEIEEIKSKTGQKVYEGTLEVASKLNEDVTTAFPVGEAIGKLQPGAYIMTARARSSAKPVSGHDEEGYERRGELATQWFIVSDLGVTALSGTDGIHGFIRSLADTSPIAGATVRLIARNNEVLGTARSDGTGYAHFERGLTKGEGGLQPALLVAEKDGEDYTFLDLSAAGFDLSDRGVKGRDAPGPLDGYLFTERGVYRPGEEVFLTGLVRDQKAEAASLPVTLIVTRPDGVEHKRLTLIDGGLGGRSATLALSRGVMTGTWRAKLYADPKGEPIAQTQFLVEDFVPERIDMTLEPQGKAIAIEDRAIIKATGKYLYGPPAANLELEGDIVVKPAKELAGFAGYKFGLADEKIEPVRAPLEGLGSTGADGKADLAITLPAIPKTGRPLEAEMIIKLKETGGRSIERVVTLPVDARQARIGIKPLFGSQGVGEGEPAAFEVIALDETGNRVAASGLKWTLSRIDQNWQWYMRDGNWGYEAASTTRRIDGGVLETGADSAGKVTVKTGWGRYRLEVAGTNGAVTSLIYNSGWVASDEVAESPEVLETALDKASYQPGETAKLRIASRHGGKALVAVLAGGLLTSQEADIPKGGGEVSIPVDGSWGPGAYATAILYRPMDEAARRMPSRAIGVKWLSIDRASSTLKVSMPVDVKVRSGSTLRVPVKITGLSPGEEARITVAAVDVGVLNLTKYQSPNPEGWFYAQTKLGLDIHDYYGRLIDGMRADRGRLRSGGDGTGGMELTAAPPSVETILSQYSGIVLVDRDGNAEVEFGLPDFNGTARVMAVAWTKSKLGHGQAEVVVRDPVALTVSAPRFITLGDGVNMDVSMHNVEGAPGAYTATVAEADAAKTQTTAPLTRQVQLAAGERKSERFTLKPDDVGSKAYAVSITGPNNVNVTRKLTFNVVPPAGDIKRTTISQIAPHGTLTLSPDMVADLIASRTSIAVSVGPDAMLDVPGLLSALDRYPYGCAEQTTSRAMPLLYANHVASTLGLATDAKLKARVQGAIERVLEMQDGSGAFGIWGPDSTDLWLTAYVTDFLTRAKEQSYAVNPRALSQALDKLGNLIAYARDLKQGGEVRAYAMYVLARNGRAPIGELRYYADTKLDAFTSPLAKAQLGAALSMMGDKERAERTFAAALSGIEEKGLPQVTRIDYGSKLRDTAALVALSAETGMSKAETPRLVSVIGKVYSSRTYTSTQEQAWMLLAANALADQASAQKLTVNGQPVTGRLVKQLTPADIAGGFTITNEGDTPADVAITVNGAALTPEPAIEKGFKVERTYYTLDGKKADMASATGGQSSVRQNDRFVVVLSVAAAEQGGRILLVDRLPAGFEIENPHLVEAGATSGLPWLKDTVKPEHAEFRDDRFVASFNFNARGSGRHGSEPEEGVDEAEGGDQDTETQLQAPSQTAPKQTASVAYVVRAVTPGAYIHPAATVEDMYRPERHARTASVKLTVTAK